MQEGRDDGSPLAAQVWRRRLPLVPGLRHPKSYIHLSRSHRLRRKSFSAKNCGSGKPNDILFTGKEPTLHLTLRIFFFSHGNYLTLSPFKNVISYQGATKQKTEQKIYIPGIILAMQILDAPLVKIHFFTYEDIFIVIGASNRLDGWCSK